MRCYYDTEFLEDGRTIDLISIALVAEDGRELYRISRAAPLRRISEHSWLVRNVVPTLPLKMGEVRTNGSLYSYLTWDKAHPDWAHVAWPEDIAVDVLDFIRATPEPELWAWYGAYDHVTLAWLWGPMSQLPKGVPMYTRDLKQEAERLGNPKLPKQAEGVHNALADARHNKVRGDYLKRRDELWHGRVSCPCSAGR